MMRWKWGFGDGCRIHRRPLRPGWRESLEGLVDRFRLALVPRGRAGGLSDAPVASCRSGVAAWAAPGAGLAKSSGRDFGDGGVSFVATSSEARIAVACGGACGVGPGC